MVLIHDGDIRQNGNMLIFLAFVFLFFFFFTFFAYIFIKNNYLFSGVIVK